MRTFIFKGNPASHLTAEVLQVSEARTLFPPQYLHGKMADGQWLVRWKNGEQHDGYTRVGSESEGIWMLEHEGYQEGTPTRRPPVEPPEERARRTILEANFCPLCGGYVSSDHWKVHEQPMNWRKGK